MSSAACVCGQRDAEREPDATDRMIVPTAADCPVHGLSAAQDRHEPPLCESKNCPNRAVGLVTDRNGVQWAACEKHARDVLGDA